MKSFLASLLAVLLLCAIPATASSSTAQPAAGPSAAAATRIMALGDSITGSPGCWRALLWQHLQNSGLTNTDFVGTLPAQGCGFTYDGENEGHGGFLATRIADENQLPGWLSSTKPDIVLMHLGTNDVWNNIAPATILAAFTKLLGQMRASNPDTKVLVAKIIPMNPSGCADCGQRVIALNNAIPGWAGANTTARSPITVVDQWTGFNTATDTYDGVHPNDTAGIQKLESRWYPPLAAMLTSTPTPTGATLVGTQSGRCLDVTSAGATQLYDCNGATTQQWTATTARELRTSTGKCLDATGTAAGANLQLATCTGQTNQQWTLGTDGALKGTQSNLCLDAYGQGTANGTRVVLWTCNSQTNQKWTRR
ncbi:ricin-type beta-trefoil lectin domain protein [Umezawaea sp. Da 62-37]|uniref:ricin-type beta-trefoil lectin domain protein n=1 Tax=Umezawaea sp. Da 62-37 TaxID=3075927 RepID=UPI0028F736FF|nr:ricin-type beta-trefoil lectin domain protein [Umezawaea sp. Da 62-37]WNV88153.1 ricin-type beta-trefoil lectin domain protein [Umezawaea sp. Da 62-37]